MMRKKLSAAGRKRVRSVVMPPTFGYKSNRENSGRSSQRSTLRLLMRPWLESLLESQECHGLKWEDKLQKIFSIVWRHASSNGFDQSEHGDIFYRWAQHTGRLNNRDHSSNKSTFRCALHSLKDCIQLTRPGDKRGERAKRTYQFIEPSHPLYDSKRKARLQRNYKIQQKDKSYDYNVDQTTTTLEVQQEVDVCKAEENSDYWNYVQNTVSTPALDAFPLSPSTSEFSMETLDGIFPVSDNDLYATSSKSPMLLAISEVTATTPVNLTRSSFADSTESASSVPNLEEFVTPYPLRNKKIIIETQPNGVIALELQTIDSEEEGIQPEATLLPESPEPGMSNVCESLFCHDKLSTGGSVVITKNRPETLSLGEFVINASLLQQQPPPTQQIIFSELDNANSVEIDSNGIGTYDIDNVSVMVELIDNSDYEGGIERFPQESSELTELPLAVLVEQANLDNFMTGEESEAFFH